MKIAEILYKDSVEEIKKPAWIIVKDKNYYQRMRDIAMGIRDLNFTIQNLGNKGYSIIRILS
jgi:hypothetical protein